MANDSLDLFNLLDESLILVIISLLPFKEAVRTSILSKCWRNFWRATQGIEFTESFFVNSDEPDDQTRENQRRDFISFANQYVANYPDMVIQKFAFTLSRPQEFLQDIHRIVAFALMRNVKTLSLDFSDPTWNADIFNNYDVPVHLPHFYNNTVIESLKLFSCTFMISDLRNFSALKELALGWVELTPTSMTTILVSCPLLESLTLKQCYNMQNLHISAPNLRLKNLVLDNNDVIGGFFIIAAPNLIKFKYSGVVGEFTLGRLPLMQEADLDFEHEEEFDGPSFLVYDLMEQLYDVNKLKLCSYTLQVLPVGPGEIGMLLPLNVRHLTLRTELHHDEFRGIIIILRSCPKIRTLTIDISPRYILEGYETPDWVDPSSFWGLNHGAIDCLRRKLKVVEMRGFKATLNELNFLQYLLDSAHKLRRLHIHVSREVGEDGGNVEIYMERAQMVQQFRRTSGILRVVIH